jgi:hypothetical protein
MGTRLYVGNLPYAVTELDLRDLFGGVGTVTDAKIVTDRETGRPRGFGFVEMSTEDEARKAIERSTAATSRDVRSRSKRPRIAAVAAVVVAAARGGGGYGGGGGGGGYGGGGGGRRRRRWRAAAADAAAGKPYLIPSPVCGRGSEGRLPSCGAGPP